MGKSGFFLVSSFELLYKKTPKVDKNIPKTFNKVTSFLKIRILKAIIKIRLQALKIEYVSGLTSLRNVKAKMFWQNDKKPSRRRKKSVSKLSGTLKSKRSQTGMKNNKLNF